MTRALVDIMKPILFLYVIGISLLYSRNLPANIQTKETDRESKISLWERRYSKDIRDTEQNEREIPLYE